MYFIWFLSKIAIEIELSSRILAKAFNCVNVFYSDFQQVFFIEPMIGSQIEIPIVG